MIGEGDYHEISTEFGPYSFKNNFCLTDLGYLNENGKITIYCEGLGDFSDGLARVKKNGKYGYIDTEGNIAIECEYEDACDFSEGLACVKKDGRYGYIDTNGNTIIDFKYYDPYDGHPRQPEVGKFVDGVASVNNGNYGYVDTKGNVVIDFKLPMARAFHDGRAFVNGAYFIDKSGNNVFHFDNYKIKSLNFYDGLLLVKKDEKYGYVNTNGEVVIDFQFDDAYSFSNGLASIKKDGKYGFIDTKGNIVINPEFDDAKYFSDELACVKKGDKYGYIDKNGNVVIDFNYDNAYDFSEGKAWVRINDRYQIINKKREVIADEIEVKNLIISYDKKR